MPYALPLESLYIDPAEPGQTGAADDMTEETTEAMADIGVAKTELVGGDTREAPTAQVT